MARGDQTYFDPVSNSNGCNPLGWAEADARLRATTYYIVTSCFRFADLKAVYFGIFASG